jgi:hypothetical protein
VPPAETSAQKIQRIQRELGNRSIQRVLAQREGGQDSGFDVDDETEGRINSQRGGGQPLDVGVQQRMQDAMGYDFSGVQVHTSPEASNLSQTLQAKAFTTGSDIFFNEGAYQPQSSGGQELLAHELTHVVQQGSGQVPGSSSGMTVNAPNDAYEQQADATARQAMSAPPAAQRESLPEEEELIQAKALDPTVQREGAEEEEMLQTKALDSAVQREGLQEEEAVQAKALESALQREELPEEEEPIQMQELDENQLEQGI